VEIRVKNPAIFCAGPTKTGHAVHSVFYLFALRDICGLRSPCYLYVDGACSSKFENIAQHSPHVIKPACILSVHGT